MKIVVGVASELPFFAPVGLTLLSELAASIKELRFLTVTKPLTKRSMTGCLII